MKRKLSLGNSSPDHCIAGAVSSILKKSAGASSSGQGSLEDLTSGSNPPIDGIKSILKKRHQNSTDDELDQDQELPRSILKSRRSEESLSPLSDDCVPMISSAAGSVTGKKDIFFFKKTKIFISKSTLEVHDAWPAFEIRNCFNNCNIPIHGVLA